MEGRTHFVAVENGGKKLHFYKNDFGTHITTQDFPNFQGMPRGYDYYIENNAMNIFMTAASGRRELNLITVAYNIDKVD